MPVLGLEKIQDYLILEEIKDFGITIHHTVESLTFTNAPTPNFYKNNQTYFGDSMVPDYKCTEKPNLMKDLTSYWIYKNNIKKNFSCLHLM